MTSMVATASRIEEKAREFEPVRLVLTVLALPFLVLGWTAFMLWRLLRLVASWLWAAAVVGWEAASAQASSTREQRGP
ncbi:hypothetical protein L3Q67_01025 [Saccharothrix sp. AJ9571]|nr:hypothetical protein L3Q67_01025 [Saccharothrix sp. AJ9571]